jgi:CRP-like cAMP-binding protein
MFSQILKSVNSVIDLPQEAKEDFLSILEIKRLRKKEIFINEGDMVDKFFFINSGCIRMFFMMEGIEKTLDLIWDGKWYADYSSIIDAQPTDLSLQALEASEVVFFTKANIEKLIDRHRSIERLGRIMAERHFIAMKSFYKETTSKSPEERYMMLLNSNPEIVGSIPQHYIASYLNIQPESLSRIRKRIAKKK